MKSPVVVPSTGVQSASVIWLHGLGADGHDFAPLVPALGLSQQVKFILPHAPVRPITLNGGLPMPGWYDLAGLTAQDREDAQGVTDSAEYVRTLIAEERAAGIPANRIFLVGFSQGGALALFTGLTHEEALGGVIGLSTYMPISAVFADKLTEINQQTPVLMVHGTQDEMVSYAFGKKTQMTLRQQGYAVTWQEYRVGHEVCAEEVQCIAQWLQQCL